MTWKIVLQQHNHHAETYTYVKVIHGFKNDDDEYIRLKHPLQKAILCHVQSGTEITVTYRDGSCTVTNPPAMKRQKDDRGRIIRWAEPTYVERKTKIVGNDAILRYLCERFGLYNGTILWRAFEH